MIDRTHFLLCLLACLLCGSVPSAAGAGTGPWRASEHNVAGWQLMTPQERIEHQRRMRSFTAYTECKAYQAGVHEQMTKRARAAGVTLTPHEQSGCEQLKARGSLK